MGTEARALGPWVLGLGRLPAVADHVCAISTESETELFSANKKSSGNPSRGQLFSSEIGSSRIRRGKPKNVNVKS